MAAPDASKERRTRELDSVAMISNIERARPEQLREGYISRLRRLLRLRRDHFEELNEQGLRLLDRSIFAAYCDCIDIGQGEAARQVLKDVRLTLALPKERKRA